MRLENTHGYRKPSIKQAVNSKLKVLRDFYIVDDKNKTEYRQMLLDAVAKYPDRDYEIVLDQAAAKILNRHFNKE